MILSLHNIESKTMLKINHSPNFVHGQWVAGSVEMSKQTNCTFCKVSEWKY